MVLISKANFMPLSNGNVSKKKKNLRKRAEKAPVQKGRNPGTVPMAEVMATAPPLFLVRALKPTGEEMSSSLLLLVY